MSGGMITTDISGKAEVVLTTKGDLATWDTARVRKGVSATNYTGLQADSAIADGLTYGATARSTLTGTGSLLYSSGANTLSELSAGTGEYTLKMNSGATAPEWVNVAAGGGAWEVLDSTKLTGDSNSYVFTPSPVITNDNYQAVCILITSRNDTDDIYLTMQVNSITTGTPYNTAWQNYDGSTGTYTWILANEWRLGKASSATASITAFLQIGDPSAVPNRMPMWTKGILSNENSFGGGACNTDIDDIDEISIAASGGGQMKTDTTIAFYGIKRT